MWTHQHMERWISLMHAILNVTEFPDGAAGLYLQLVNATLNTTSIL